MFKISGKKTLLLLVCSFIVSLPLVASGDEDKGFDKFLKHNTDKSLIVVGSPNDSDEDVEKIFCDVDGCNERFTTESELDSHKAFAHGQGQTLQRQIVPVSNQDMHTIVAEQAQIFHLVGIDSKALSGFATYFMQMGQNQALQQTLGQVVPTQQQELGAHSAHIKKLTKNVADLEKKLERFTFQAGGVTEQLKHLKGSLQALSDKINGNGDRGLILVVANLERGLDEIQKIVRDGSNQEEGLVTKITQLQLLVNGVNGVNGVVSITNNLNIRLLAVEAATSPYAALDWMTKHFLGYESFKDLIEGNWRFNAGVLILLQFIEYGGNGVLKKLPRIIGKPLAKLALSPISMTKGALFLVLISQGAMHKNWQQFSKLTMLSREKAKKYCIIAVLCGVPTCTVALCFLKYGTVDPRAALRAIVKNLKHHQR